MRLNLDYGSGSLPRPTGYGSRMCRRTRIDTLAGLLRDMSNSPYVTRTSVGKSVEGRDIPLLTITDPSASGEREEGHLADVPPTRVGSRELLDRRRVDPFRRHRPIRWRRGSGERRFVKILPWCDPDGVAHGGVRFNRNGYDLNRNWDFVDPAKMPEITAERRAIFDWVDAGKRVDFFLTLHNTETNEYLHGPPDSTGALRPLLERVNQVTGLKARRSRRPTRPVSQAAYNKVGKPGRMNVVQGLYHDRKLPAFEVEMRIAKHPKLGHRPNMDDRKLAGAELIQAIWKAVVTPPRAGLVFGA